MSTTDPIVIEDDNGARFHPWIGDEGQVGYRVEMPDGKVQFIYFNASTGGAPPSVFVYNDTTGSPDSGMTLHFYDLDESLG